MMGKRAAREAFRGHEHLTKRETAADQHEQRNSDLPDPERALVLRRRKPEPGTRRIGEDRRREQRADHEAGDERWLPHEPMLAQQPERTENAAHQSVNHAGSDARDAGNHIVRAAQFLEAPFERLGDVDERQDFRQLVAGDYELQPDAGIAKQIVAFEHELMIDAPGDAHLLRLLEQAIGRKVDVPVHRGARTCEFERCLGGHRHCRRIAHVRFRQAPRKAIERAVGLEAQQGFVDDACLEQPHVPPVGRIRGAGDQPGEGGDIHDADSDHGVLQRGAEKRRPIGGDGARRQRFRPTSTRRASSSSTPTPPRPGAIRPRSR